MADISANYELSIGPARMKIGEGKDGRKQLFFDPEAVDPDCKLRRRKVIQVADDLGRREFYLEGDEIIEEDEIDDEPDDLDDLDDTGHRLVEIERLTGTRLKDGESPEWFLASFAASFAEYCRHTAPDRVAILASTHHTGGGPVERQQQHAEHGNHVARTSEAPPAVGDESDDAAAACERKTAKSRISLDEYNVKARDYLKIHPEAGPRALINHLGCGAGTVYKLPAFLAVRGEREKGRTPKGVSLTEPMANAATKEDGELAKLVNEQRRDMRTHKVHSRERI